MIEAGDTCQNIRRLPGTGRNSFVELPSGMSPTAHFGNTRFPEKLIVAAVGICMNIPLITIEKLQRTFLGAINGKLINSQRRTSPFPDINPHPGLLQFAIALFLQGNNRVIGE